MDNKVISYHKMRQWVGILGISLPFSLWIGNFCFNHLHLMNNSKLMHGCSYYNDELPSLKNSISDFYYTSMGELFVGTLCAVAFFLFCYKGYPKREGEKMPSDSLMTNLAGFFALSVVIFPTHEDCCFELADNFRIFISSNFVGWIHNISAILFFITLGIISLFNFRRTDKVENFGKMPSHNFYRNCSIGIFTSLALVLILHIPMINKLEFVQSLPTIYIFETTTLLFFGASWIKKGMISSD